MNAFASYLLSVFDALSQLLGRIIGWTGNANESISGAAWRKREEHPWVYRVIDFLLRPLGPDHCQEAFLADILRAGELLRQFGGTQLIVLDEEGLQGRLRAAESVGYARGYNAYRGSTELLDDAQEATGKAGELEWVWGEKNFWAWFNALDEDTVRRMELEGPVFPVEMPNMAEWRHWAAMAIAEAKARQPKVTPPATNGMTED